MKYNEIEELYAILKSRNYTIEYTPCFDGGQVIIYDDEVRIGDFVQHKHAFDNYAYVESMGMGFDECMTWTLPQAVMLVETFLEDNNGLL